MIDLFQPGAYFRCPGGNVENVDDHAPVIRWAGYNIGGDPCVNRSPDVWSTFRAKHEQKGIETFPWIHCRTLADVTFLCQTAVAHGAEAIGLNLEDVQNDFTQQGVPLSEVEKVVAANWNGPIHLASLPWLQNGQGWSVFARAVFALEIMADEQNIFPGDMPSDGIIADCVEHAFVEGATQITLMLKTKGYQPNAYGQSWSICHSLFTGDDITPTTEAWKQWVQAQPCVRVEEEDGDVPPDPDEKQWYEKPYLTGPAKGPATLPRILYPPSAGKGTFTGEDVMAFKRAISRAGRLKPWSPSTWSQTYGEEFALGKGTGNVGDSGVRGFQRQEFPGQPNMQTGYLGDKTYQRIRRALISDPSSPNYKLPLLDATAVKMLNRALKEFSADAAIADFRKHLTDFCIRAEAADSELWTYSQQRPYTGLGVAPEKAHKNDCSSYVILAYYWARTKSELPVPDPSDYEYSGYGNTWDDLDGHEKVTSGSYLVGDLAHYDGHVTLCRKPGDKDTSVWSSFGSEPRPEPKALHYRGDFLKVVRPPIGDDV